MCYLVWLLTVAEAEAEIFGVVFEALLPGQILGVCSGIFSPKLYPWGKVLQSLYRGGLKQNLTTVVTLFGFFGKG